MKSFWALFAWLTIGTCDKQSGLKPSPTNPSIPGNGGTFALFVMWNNPMNQTVRESLDRIYVPHFARVLHIGGKERCNGAKAEHKGYFMYACFADALSVALETRLAEHVDGFWIIGDDVVFRHWLLRDVTIANGLANFQMQCDLGAAGPNLPSSWPWWDRPIGVNKLIAYMRAHAEEEFTRAVLAHATQCGGNITCAARFHCLTDVLYVPSARHDVIARFIRYANLFAHAPNDRVFTEIVTPALVRAAIANTSVAVRSIQDRVYSMNNGLHERRSQLVFEWVQATFDAHSLKDKTDDRVFAHPLKMSNRKYLSEYARLFAGNSSDRVGSSAL